MQLQIEIRLMNLNFRAEHELSDKPIIALLPGSRKQEITKMLSVMLRMVNDFTEYQFVIAGAPSQDFEILQALYQKTNVAFINNKTYDLLSYFICCSCNFGHCNFRNSLV